MALEGSIVGGLTNQWGVASEGWSSRRTEHSCHTSGRLGSAPNTDVIYFASPIIFSQNVSAIKQQKPIQGFIQAIDNLRE